jgi:capsular exopolysaccharide synthesis family protein
MDRTERIEKPKQPERQVVDAKQYLWVILRHKWVIIIAFLVTVSSTFFYLSHVIPMYKASVKILIEEGRGELSMLNNLNFLEQEKVAKQLTTYCELLKSRQLLSKVVENLKLQELPEKEDRSKSFLTRLKGLINLNDPTVISEGDIPENLKIRHVAEQLQKSINATPIKDTNIIEVAVSEADPKMAANIANELAKVFITYNLQSLVSDAKSGYDFINEQSQIVSENLHDAEENLKAFKEKEKVVELSEEAKITLDKLSNAEANYNNTITQRKEAEIRLKSVQSELKTQAETIKSTTISENPMVQQLKGQLYSHEIEMAGLLKTYSETAPEVVQVKTRISQTKERLEQEVGRIVTAEVSSVNPVHQSLVDRLAQLEADTIVFGVIAEAQKGSVEQFKRGLDQLPSKELQLARLERDRGVANQTYMMLMQRKEEMRLAQAVQTGNVSVADPAVMPFYPYNMQKMLNLMLGAVLGLFLGIGFAFFLEHLENTIRTPDDVTQYLGLSVLGVIPRDKKAKKSKTPIIMVSRRAKQSAAEAYRGLRTTLMAHAGNPLKTITITSAGPQEGKSITTVNLGMALAQAGKNVLLVDADLRRPALHRIFNVERHDGLSTVLAGKSTLDEVVIKALDPNLLTSGTLPSDTSEVLGSDQMKDLIKQAKEQYDLVLFDAAPALGMADSLVLASETDGTILVVKTGRATRKMLKIMVSQLEEVGANILGVVLNDVNIKRDRYYSDYYYYYYYYYSPYKDEEGNQIERRKRHKGKRS